MNKLFVLLVLWAYCSRANSQGFMAEYKKPLNRIQNTKDLSVYRPFAENELTFYAYDKNFKPGFEILKKRVMSAYNDNGTYYWIKQECKDVLDAGGDMSN